MGGMKSRERTIGEVEKLTGIPKRKLKYMIERGLMHPSGRTDIGYWLYSEEDIRTVQHISWLQRLDYPEKSIRILLLTTPARWREELERQTARLTEKKERIEDQLFLSEFLRFQAAEIGDFPLGGDTQAAWKQGEKEALCRLLYRMFSGEETKTLLQGMGQPTDSLSDARERVERLCKVFRHENDLTPMQVLLILRLARTLSGLESVLDILAEKEGALALATEAMEKYCENWKEN